MATTKEVVTPESGDESAEKVTPAWKRKNTPGKNSYLKVMLDDQTLNRLHDLTERVKKEFNDEMMIQTTTTTTTSERGSRAALEKSNNRPKNPKNSKGRPLRIRSRSRHSLHMTFFFGGEVLCELPTEELRQWHALIAERLHQSGFFLAHARKDVSEEGTNEDDSFWFRLREMVVFPPRRNNLVVTVLEASPAWDKLHEDIRAIGKNMDSEGLCEITKRSKDRWTAHVTLANLQGGTKNETKTLSNLLKSFSGTHFSSSESECAAVTVKGISMGGPIPEQLELDWDFRYKDGLIEK